MDRTMNAAEFDQAVAAAVAATRATITPTARKTGRTAALPYVPVLRYQPADGSRGWVQQIRGVSYATREEAIAKAERRLRVQMTVLAAQLREPLYRALREYHGLPRELPS